MTARRAAKVDANQGRIVAALRLAGAHVILLHMVGGGVPDLLCSYRGVWHVLECKDKGGTLTPEQEMLIRLVNAPVHIVRNEREALLAIGAIIE